MKRFFLTALSASSLFISMAATADTAVKGDAAPTVVSRQVANFDTLAVKGNYQVKISGGQAQSVNLSGDADALKNVVTDVKNNTLGITDNGKINFSSHPPVIISITVPTLKGVAADGNNAIDINQPKSDTFSLASKGNEKITITGSTDKFDLASMDSSNIDAKDFVAKIVNLKAKGNAQIKINATQELQAKSMGNINVLIYGNPKKVKTSVWGNGVYKAAQ